ncbi:MAG: Ada metal-binding domain-containing protein [Bacillota bacterium]|nr:Ada metal-binding domain-containing protein [Bacillota bacterium]
MNNYSAVLRIEYGRTAYLFTGDAEDVSEKEMLSSGLTLESDLLKVGHHGSSSSSMDSFLQAVQPKYAVISVGTDNDYGHPAATTIKNLRAVGAQVYRTDQQGTIVATSDGTTIAVNKAPTTVKTPISNILPATVYVAPEQSEEAYKYIGNKNSKTFHLPTCNSLPYPKNRVYFDSREEAINQGFTPCGRCKP